MSSPQSPDIRHPKIKAKKYLGQNFLVDPRFLARIVKACGLTAADTVIEIGAGTGNLTRLLLGQAQHVIAVEKDPELCEFLSSDLGANDRLQIREGDILNLDWHQWPAPNKIIGNIPYQISTPLIEKLIKNREVCPQAYLTVQREFGQRLTAGPNSKDYGSLSCFIQYYADVHILFDIPKTCFRPIPKVTSCFLNIQFRRPVVSARNEPWLFQVIRQAFAGRRRKLANALAAVRTATEVKDLLRDLHLNENIRAEQLTVNDFIRIADILWEKNKGERKERKSQAGFRPSRQTSV